MGQSRIFEDLLPRSWRAKLFSPELGLLGQGMRFAVAGGVVSAIYIATTVILADAVGVAFEVALPIGYVIGLMTHFTLQRWFVWVQDDDFALPIHHQVGRYLCVAAAQYGLTAASTSLLPSWTGLPTEVVYVLTVGAIVSLNFFVFRHGIFHARVDADDALATPAVTADVGSVPEAAPPLR